MEELILTRTIYNRVCAPIAHQVTLHKARERCNCNNRRICSWIENLKTFKMIGTALAPSIPDKEQKVQRSGSPLD